jgi:acyl-CoA hydrolase/RimJ/RimL family protein N-acetyltransferase
MTLEHEGEWLEETRRAHPEKFASEADIFKHVHRGDRIFIGTGCGEPQYLVGALIRYVESNPGAIFDAEVFHVWTLGVAPYTDRKFQQNFRHNSFFVGNHTREAVNEGLADYTPIFLCQVPELFRRGMEPIDVALVQASPPDAHGYMSLGISVDIGKAAVEAAPLVIVQVNSSMPRVHGDGFIHVDDVDFIVPHDEPLLEFESSAEDEVVQRIGKHVAKLVKDGDTIQVGYGSIPDAILSNLREKKHLGVHTELISDGLVELMRRGVIDNSRKTVNRGKSIATFCMGHRGTYEYLHDNPSLQFKTVDYTNDPRVIAGHDNMTAINTALEIDLSGQVTAESLGKTFFSGVGGQADFMRGAVLAKGGKTILALPSTADRGKVSRIAPTLKEGAGVTLHRSDVHYVVTEYGIAYLHGKNIRERAMELIAIAHPDFRGELVRQAKALNLIFGDQAFIPGKKGEYPEELETYRTTSKGMEVLLRPVKISDEPLLKDFFYSLSDTSLYRRFMSTRMDIPHERLQDYTVIDYTREMVIMATVPRGEGKREDIVGVAQYWINQGNHTAEVAFAIRDDHQGKGIGSELLNYMTYLAKRHGLMGFTAEVLAENRAMLHLFRKQDFDLESRLEGGSYELKMAFRGM